jgi:hypothetical protein
VHLHGQDSAHHPHGLAETGLGVWAMAG